jgi:Phosphotransferase enzyme family
MTEEPLAGGMGNQGEVLRIGDTVRRPVGDHAPAVSRLLEHLAIEGFPAPVPTGCDEQGRETFRWIEGDVPVPPYPEWSLTDDALASVGRLLRSYHDAVRSFSTSPHLHWSGELADPEGGAIVCHNDVCPENVVFRNGEAAALLDFDLAAPGRPVWDLAQTARMWTPLRPPELPGERAHLDPFRRLAVLAHAYGLENSEHQPLVEAIITSKRFGTRFVERRVSAGEPAFVEAWEQRGGKAGDDRLIIWLKENVDAFLRRSQPLRRRSARSISRRRTPLGDAAGDGHEDAVGADHLERQPRFTEPSGRRRGTHISTIVSHG